jgi:hypothetical protein
MALGAAGGQATRDLRDGEARLAAALGITQMPVLGGIARGRDLLAGHGLDPERLAREIPRGCGSIAGTNHLGPP